MKKYIVDIVLIFALIEILLFITISSLGNIPYLYFISARLLLAAIILILTFRCFKTIFYDKKLTKRTKNYATLSVVFIVCFLFLESIFMFIPRSHGTGYALSSKVWETRYSKVKNELGNRDLELKNDKSVVVFVGDSFTWGHGTKRIEDRYSNIVGSRSINHNTTNIAACGLDTRLEFESLLKFVKTTKIKPKKIVLQYYGNDIQEVAKENGLVYGGMDPYDHHNFIIENLVRGSFLINYVYWLYPHGNAEKYIEFIKNAYQDEEIFKQHTEDLSKFIDYSERNSIELIVIVFPFLQDIPLSEELYSKKITDFFKEKNVKTINMSKPLNNLEVQKLVVNNNDGHPSNFVHKVAADELLKLINE